MNNESLFDMYPWYRQHQNAVDTIAACLAVDVEEVLMGLDGKFNPLQQSAAVCRSKGF